MKKIIVILAITSIPFGTFAQSNGSLYNNNGLSRTPSGSDTMGRVRSINPVQNNSINTKNPNQLPNYNQNNANYNNNSMQNNQPSVPTSPSTGNGTYTDPSRNTPPPTPYNNGTLGNGH